MAVVIFVMPQPAGEGRRLHEAARFGHGGVAERFVEQAAQAWLELVVAGLFIARHKAREDAHDAHGVHRAEHREAFVEVAARAARAIEIGADGSLAGFGRDVAAGVVQQHRHVPLAPAEDGVLEVEQADALQAVALREPDEVFGVRVAQDEGAGIILGLGDQVLAHALPAQAGLFADAHVQIALRHPFDEQVDVRGEGEMIVGQDRPFAAAIGQREGRRRAMDGGEDIAGGGIERDLVAAARDDFGEEIVAKVFEDGEAVRDILVEDFRRGEAEIDEMAGDGGEGFDARGGEARDGVPAERETFLVRCAGRAGLGFQRRGIHQHRRFGLAAHALVAARGGVGIERRARGFAPASAGEEFLDLA
jgi:hypothetical protein